MTNKKVSNKVVRLMDSLNESVGTLDFDDIDFLIEGLMNIKVSKKVSDLSQGAMLTASNKIQKLVKENNKLKNAMNKKS